jgi:pyruvate formate lyase activating enzyme
LSVKRPPLFFTETEGDEVVICNLCPNSCHIQSGRFGACGVRGNKGGKGIIPFYGFISALAMDPIEKKPLYHFKPGSKILSLGFAGCNLHCPFCQNYHISQNTDIPGKWMEPNEVISAALHNDSPSIAYTYSEPLIHAEYIIDCMVLARKHGVANVLVTNGCINADPAAKILALTDAANVDLKCFSAQTYGKTLAGGAASSGAASSGVENENIFKTVCEFIKLSHEMGVHIEVTTLVVPGLNDSAEELNSAAQFIASVNSEIPLHLTAYHPDYRWNAPRTDPDFLMKTAKEAKKILKFVHTGNI